MVNTHHLWWPRRDYKTALERKFRNLPCNIVTIDVKTHELLHRNSQPPRKPSNEEMADAVGRHNDGCCGCRRG